MSVCSLHFAYVVDKTAKGFFFTTLELLDKVT